MNITYNQAIIIAEENILNVLKKYNLTHEETKREDICVVFGNYEANDHYYISALWCIYKDHYGDSCRIDISKMGRIYSEEFLEDFREPFEFNSEDD